MNDMFQQCAQMMNGVMGSGMMGAGMTGSAGWASPWYWLGWAWVLALIALIIVALIWTIRRAGRPTVGSESPLGIVQRRYARGDLSAEEFETMKRQLSEN